MAHKGCLDCKYNHSTMDEHECLLHHDIEYKEWWNRNGNKPSNDITEEMPCFEDNDTQKILNDILSELKALLEFENKKIK
jgi:hypothetical protein